MSYYTVVPKVLNDNGYYVSNFCSGDWRVLFEDLWIQLNPMNTRIRDKNDRVWLETCDGHRVEASVDDPELDCKCYSKDFNPDLTSSLSTVLAKSLNGVDYILYGTVLSILNTDTFVYIVYYTLVGATCSIRIYCINKDTALIDSIVIDSVDTVPTNVILSIDSDYNLQISLGDIQYKIAGDYTINAYALTEPAVQTYYYNNSTFTIVDGILLRDSVQLFPVKDSFINCVFGYEEQTCFAQYIGGVMTIYNLEGIAISESHSDANAAYFFNQHGSIISIEAFDNIIKIKGVE